MKPMLTTPPHVLRASKQLLSSALKKNMNGKPRVTTHLRKLLIETKTGNKEKNRENETMQREIKY